MDAAEPTDSDANSTFNQARALLAEGHLDQACQLFEASQRLEPALGTLLNLADCAERAGQAALAHRRFSEAAAWAHRTAERRREEVALQRAEALKARLVLLAVDAGHTQAVGQLRSVRDPALVIDFVIDAKQPTAVDPGTYSLRVVAAGRQPFEAVLELVRPGEVIHVLAPLVPEVPAAAPAPAPEPMAPKVPQTPVQGPQPLALAAGIGGGLLAAAGVAGIIYSQSVMTRVARQQPGGPDANSPTVTRAEYATVTVLYPVAVAGTVVGAAAVLAAVLVPQRGRPAAAALFPLPGGFGAAVRGEF